MPRTARKKAEELPYHIMCRSISEVDLFCDSEDKKKAMQKGHQFIKMMSGTKVMTEIDEDILREYTENEYRSEKRYMERSAEPDYIVKAVCRVAGEDNLEIIRLKYSRKSKDIRALAVYWMRFLCGYTFKKIGEYIGDMSLSGIIRLSNEGYKLHLKNTQYQEVFKTLLSAA